MEKIKTWILEHKPIAIGIVIVLLLILIGLF